MMRRLALALALAAALTAPAFAQQATIALPPAIQSASLTTTYDLTTATGTQAITGTGFTPTTCNFLATVNAGSAVSIGSSDSAKNGRFISVASDGTTWGAGNSAIQYSNGAGTNAQVGNISTYDATGVTLAWTKIGAPTGTLQLKITCYR